MRNRLLPTLYCLFALWLLSPTALLAQQTSDSLPAVAKDTLASNPLVVNPEDTVLRIINLNPYFTIHVDSLFEYDMNINRPQERYYWYIRNSPVGVRIDRNSGRLSFRADKSFFRSGRLKYDLPYKIDIGVQNLFHAAEHTDTSFTILFYSTEVIVSRLKPTVNGLQVLEEGDSVRFRVQCESGTFPIEQIIMNASAPIHSFRAVTRCNEEFFWMIPFDFIRDSDTAKPRSLTLQFIGNDRFLNRDTAVVSLLIRPGINYPQRNEEHRVLSHELTKYIKDLKLTFYVVSRNIKSNKKTRTGFDVGASTLSLAGTVLSTATAQGAKDIGKVLPSIGLTMVPVKEAVAPNKVQEQNTASQVRAAIKRLEYMLSENPLVGERDPEVLAKMRRLRDEIKQTRVQLVDLPIVEFEQVSAADVEAYFNSPRVNRKYKLKVN
ncbi:MAG: hypothetical protein FJX89_11185 [Bacteroidetes bacterium]|nr:hypothetical protein [Bacteroidota bacterium]